MRAHLLGLAESARQIRAGTLSPVDLVEALLAWIDALEPQLQAWVTLDRTGALDTARRCTAEAQRGQIRGPLHGVPVGIKDIFFTAGMRTTCLRVADFRRLRPGLRCHRGGPAQGRWGDYPGQDPHHRIRHPRSGPDT